MTREQIEALRPDDNAPMVADVRASDLRMLCDAALSAPAPHSAIEAERLLRITRENFEIECADADKILALFPDLHRSEGGRLPVAALVKAICDLSARLKRAEAAPELHVERKP